MLQFWFDPRRYTCAVTSSPVTCKLNVKPVTVGKYIESKATFQNALEQCKWICIFCQLNAIIQIEASDLAFLHQS